MKELVKGFTGQLREALDIAGRAKLAPKHDIRNIVITGLGGSGIGGSIIAELVSHECPVPVIINKDYFLPEFVNANTLVIVSSYSGNTEETTSAMSQAIARKAQVVCITSGGQVQQLAAEHGYDCILVPGGNPPRSCIGYSLVQLLRIFQFNRFVKTDFLAEVEASIAQLDQEEHKIQAEALSIAGVLHQTIPVIYSLGSSEGVAVRFRQQINENSKMLCWHHVFPEMNHNELVGWATRQEQVSVVTFHTSFDFERTKKRYEICRDIFQKNAASVTDIYAKGHTRLEQFFYLIHIGDWISCYIADLKGVDAVEVNVITDLKNALAKY